MLCEYSNQYLYVRQWPQLDKDLEEEVEKGEITKEDACYAVNIMSPFAGCQPFTPDSKGCGSCEFCVPRQ
jgi:hypothetical protein